MKTLTKVALYGVAAAAMAASVPANAAYVFDFTTSSNSSGSVGNVRTFIGTGTGADLNKTLTLTATAWSLNSNGTLNNAQLGRWDYGLGVVSQDDSNHVIDNSSRDDFVLFQFGSDVEVTFATFKTFGLDNDASVGVGPGTAPVADGKTLNSLLTGSYWTSDTANEGNTSLTSRDINPDNKFGKLWMIGADFAERNGNDGFKLSSLTVNKVTNAVPEPATWAMMITGFGFVGGSMRRRSATKTALQTA